MKHKCEGDRDKKERIDEFLKSDLTSFDEELLKSVFNNNDYQEVLEKNLSRQFYETMSHEESDDDICEDKLYKIHYLINTRADGKRNSRVLRLYRWSYSIAGAVLIPLLLYIGFSVFQGDRKSIIEIFSPAWGKTQFVLPDGTQGWLNNNSSLKYHSNFLKKRKVFLEGEAFFDVTSIKNKPFLVDADAIEIKVLGTKFNVASFNDDNEIEVVLEEGRINIKDKVNNNSLDIDPDKLVVYNKNLSMFSWESIETKKYTSWTEGRLVFRNDPIEKVAERLGRWYNIKVELVGNVNKDLRLRGTFIDESLERVLYYLKYSLPIDYKIEKGIVGNNDVFNGDKVTLIIL